MVRECDSVEHTALLVTALEHYDEGNVIVYSPTINKVEETVDYLEDKGIAAVGYHAKMDTASRRRNQERWMSDEVQRAGGNDRVRVGDQQGDGAGGDAYGAAEIGGAVLSGGGTRGAGWKAGGLHFAVAQAGCGAAGIFCQSDSGFGGTRSARGSDTTSYGDLWSRGNAGTAQICTHFGETPKWESCGACDVCGAAPEWLTRGGEHGCGAADRWRRCVPARPRVAASTLGEVDAELREYLREWRRATAKEQSMPAYVVLHDSSLDEICRMRPTTIAQLMTITGIGERKAELYGREILAALRRYQEGERAAALPEKKTAPALETLQLLTEGKSFEEIAQIRGRQVATVVNAVAGLVEKGEVEFRPEWIDRNKLAVIEAACANLGLERLERLKPLKDVLPPEITYDEIRLVVARLRRAGSGKKADIPA